MRKTHLLLILSFFIAAEALVAYGQGGTGDGNTDGSNSPASPGLLEKIISMYEEGVRFKEVIPVAAGILAFSYFIWKTSQILSKRDIFILRRNLAAKGKEISMKKKAALYVAKYVVIFPTIVYFWVVVCFFFMYALNTSLSFDVLTLMMVGIVVASRTASYWNEKLAEDIMKFLPFNLLFTLLYKPDLDFKTINSTLQQFPMVMLELTIFILFVGLFEAILKSVHFIVTKNRRSSDNHEMSN